MSDNKSTKLILNRNQIEYIMKMLEISNPQQAMEAFAKMLSSEQADPMKMGAYIDKIIQAKPKGAK